MTLKKLIFWYGLIVTLFLYSCDTSKDSSDAFQGMYALDKIEAYNTIDKTWESAPGREGTSGYILYDGKGHMGVHLIPKGYKDFDTNKNIDSLSIDDLRKLTRFYKSNFVYFANYTITGSTIDHQRITATEPKNWGSSLIRDFTFKGDTLILTAHEKIDGRELRLRWIKM